MGNCIAVVDDDRSHRSILCSILREWGYETREASDGRQAIELAGAKNRPSAMLLDVRMPVKSGLEALPEILATAPGMPVILITAFSDLEGAISAIRMGAWDYLVKPLDFAKLRAVLENALADGKTVKDEFPLPGKSEPMQELAKMIASVGPTNANVLITGESGTGKELAARALHQASRRNGGPFVAINCGAFTESLLASELFGHEKGAFTGADKKHEGLFAKAAGGTIFLDEVGEMPASMQVRLLRVLQEREILSVGGTTPKPLDCRIIAATNRDLPAEVEAGHFRADLFYRLNVVDLHMPALRERQGDIPLLAEKFAANFAKINNKTFRGITSDAMSRLVAWHWPGNVRELENVMERAVILMPGEYVGLRELPLHFQQGKPDAKMERRMEEAGPITLEEVEKRAIFKMMEKYGNNKSEVARSLGISRKTLYAKLERYREGE